MEMLVVITIFVTVSGIIMTILYTTLRGSSKTAINTTVAQNGNYALSVVSKTIANSTTVNSMAGNIASCPILPTPDPALPTSYIDLTGTDGYRKVIVCNDSSNKFTITDYSTTPETITDLIDYSQVSLISSSCSFSCDQKNDLYTTPLITIKFGLGQAASNSAIEKQALASFETSVSLRNWK